MSNQPPYGYNQEGGGFPPPPQGESKTKTLGMNYNTAALLCYLPSCLCCANVIFSILWLATEPKENRLLRFHALQGLLLFALWFVVSILFRVFGIGVSITAPGDLTRAGGFGILLLIQLAVGVGFLVLHIMGMVKASQGAWWKIPVIGDIAEKNS
jgi:uncharacterized membrane protein